MGLGSLAAMAAQVNTYYSEKHGPFWARCDFYFHAQVTNNTEMGQRFTMHDNGGDGFVKWEVMVEPHTTWSGNILWDTPSVYSHISNHCYVYVTGNSPQDGNCSLAFVENGGEKNTYIEIYNGTVQRYSAGTLTLNAMGDTIKFTLNPYQNSNN